MRGVACDECVIGILHVELDSTVQPRGGVTLTREECSAIEVLAHAGFVPPLAWSTHHVESEHEDLDAPIPYRLAGSGRSALHRAS